MARREENQLALRDAQGALELLDSQIEVIRASVCPGYSDMELALFLWYCQRYSLDPLSKETYTFKQGSKVVVGVGIDGFRKRANDTRCYAPGPTRYETDDKGKLIAAHVGVRRWMPESQQWVDCEESAYLAEFAKGGNWDRMPRVMLAKCAEARALRRLFPNQLGGLYERSEIEGVKRETRAERFESQMPPIDVQAEPESAPPKHSDTPREAVWRQGKLLGADAALIQQIVADAVEAGQVPQDSARWTDEHAATLIQQIEWATRSDDNGTT